MKYGKLTFTVEGDQIDPPLLSTREKVRLILIITHEILLRYHDKAQLDACPGLKMHNVLNNAA